MDKRKLVDLIDNPEEISENDLENLEALAANFPYCQILHLLIAKYAHQQASMLANQKIRRAATYTYNRNTLRKFIFENDNSIPQTNETIIDQSVKTQSYQPENEIIELNNLVLEDENDPDDTRSFFEMIEDLEKPISEPIGEITTTETKIDFILPAEEAKDEVEFTPQEEISENHNHQILETVSEVKEENEQLISSELGETPEIVSYFQDIESDLTHTPDEGEDHKLYESINEGKALGLYYDGKIIETIHMYKQLMQIYPEKKRYYEDQLKDLLGNKIYLYDIENESLISEKNDANLSPSLEDKTSFEQIEDKQATSDELTDVALISDHQTDAEEIQAIDVDEKPLQNETQSLDNQIIDEANYDLPDSFFQTPKEYNLAVEDESEYFAKNPNFVKSDDNTAEHLWEKFHNPFEELGEIKIDLETENIESESAVNNATVENEISENISNTVVWENFDNEISPTQENETNNSFFDQITDNQLFGEKLISNPRAEEITEISLPLESNSIFTEIEDNTSDIEDNVIDFETAYLTESQAILLFNQGKNEEAIKIYESLIERNPQKSNYYHNQINVLKGTDLQKAQETKASNNTIYGFDANQDDLNESTALQLFTQGKTAEAILIYEQLIEKHPEKRGYFISQIEILKS